MLQTGLQHKEFYSAATKKEGRAVAGQIKSKERVADHGEVFTNEREVNAMLDMVKPCRKPFSGTCLWQRQFSGGSASAQVGGR